MKISVLGPLYLEHNGIALTPTAGKPRTVFASLLINESAVVPTSALVREVWGDTPPKSAATTMQTYVLQVRKTLAAATGLSLAEVSATMLQTKGNGYVFHAPGGALDLTEYQRLERTGVVAMTDGDLLTAVQALRAALRMWRGPALADVYGGPMIEAVVAQLEQARLTMLDYRIELELRLGLHQEILGELNSLVRRYPYHEDLTAQFIVALYRSGRREYALHTLRRMRSTMIDELGLEPSPKFGRLAKALVDRDPTLAEMPVVPLPRSAESGRAPALAGYQW
jgi:DNA-binding SARP family transcriptional activator